MRYGAGAQFWGSGVDLPMMLLIGGGIFSASYLMMTGHMRDAGAHRLVVTLVFGLIHGFGFASSLLEMHLPAKAGWRSCWSASTSAWRSGRSPWCSAALLIARLCVRVHLGMPRPAVHGPRRLRSWSVKDCSGFGRTVALG